MKIIHSKDNSLGKGDLFTIAGVHKLDKRWWPRLKAWVLRRPAPVLPNLVVFEVQQVTGPQSAAFAHTRKED